MPKNKKKNSKKEKKFFEKTWVKFIGVISSISLLIGIGFSIGIFKGEIDCKLERIEVIENYQSQIDEYRETCNAIMIKDLDDGIKDLDEIIELLKRIKDEK